VPRSMPAVIGLPQEGAAVEGGPAPPPVAPQRQGWRALLYCHRALGLHRRAASVLRGGDRRRKAWPPSTAGACMASAAGLASLHRRGPPWWWPSSQSLWPPSTAVTRLASLHHRRVPGLPPPWHRLWPPSTAAPPRASVVVTVVVSVVVASEQGRSERKGRDVDEIEEGARGNKGDAPSCVRK
jgi:hypothetical protein